MNFIILGSLWHWFLDVLKIFGDKYLQKHIFYNIFHENAHVIDYLSHNDSGLGIGGAAKGVGLFSKWLLTSSLIKHKVDTG